MTQVSIGGNVTAAVVSTGDEVVQAGRMPPWHASPEYGSFANVARLSDDLAANVTDAGNKSSEAASRVVARAEHWSQNTAGKLEELISSHRDQLSHIDSLVHVLGKETAARNLRCLAGGRKVRELTRRQAGSYILLLRVLAGEG